MCCVCIQTILGEKKTSVVFWSLLFWRRNQEKEHGQAEGRGWDLNRQEGRKEEEGRKETLPNLPCMAHRKASVWCDYYSAMVCMPLGMTIVEGEITPLWQ